jgi:Xaa-Pro aminopeptidase
MTDQLDFSRILEAMREEGIDALTAMDPHTVAILTNYCNELFLEFGFKEAPTCVVILATGETVAVMPRMHHKREHAPWIDEFAGRYTDSCYHDQGLMVDTLTRTLKEKGLGSGRIGFEMGFVPAAIMRRIEGALPNMRAVDGEWIWCQFRAVKTEKQLNFIRSGVDACEAGVRAIRADWKEGESIHRLLDEFNRVIREHGASGFRAYQRAIAKQWEPHPGRDQNLSEDFLIRLDDDTEVLFDLIVRYEGFISDWKRSFYLGTPPPAIADLYEFEWSVVQALAEEVKPGMTKVEAQKACDERLDRDGLNNWWCIHSVGLEIHEEPLIGACPETTEDGEVNRARPVRFPGHLQGVDEKLRFEPNVVVMVETKKTEDPYLMTEEGLVRLNSLPQELFVV